MGLLSSMFNNIVQKKSNGTFGNRSKYIYYKIVDFDQITNTYKLQCINTRPLFQANLADIVFDLDILHGLHPIQACYIGIEYGKLVNNTSSKSTQNSSEKHAIVEYSSSRYGNYALCYQNRHGELGFIDHNTQETFLMSPSDIAFSEDLIRDFDAAQAFYIGLLTGLKMDAPTPKHMDISTKLKPVHLRVVK